MNQRPLRAPGAHDLPDAPGLLPGRPNVVLDHRLGLCAQEGIRLALAFCGRPSLPDRGDAPAAVTEGALDEVERVGAPDRLLAGKLAELRAVLLLHPDDSSALREEVQHESDTLPGISIRVKNAQGEVIAESPESGKVFDEGGLLTTGIPDGNQARSLVGRGGEQYRVLSGGFELGTRYRVDAALSLTKEERLLADYRRMLISFLAAALAVALAAGFLIARRGLRPVSRLAAIVDELGPDQLHRRIGEEAWPAEVKPLATNFNRLLSRLEECASRPDRHERRLLPYGQGLRLECPFRLNWSI